MFLNWVVNISVSILKKFDNVIVMWKIYIHNARRKLINISGGEENRKIFKKYICLEILKIEKEWGDILQIN